MRPITSTKNRICDFCDNNIYVGDTCFLYYTYGSVACLHCHTNLVERENY